MRPAPSGSVINWLNAENSSELYLTSVTIGELAYGIAALPEGSRKVSLAEAASRFIHAGFGGRVLSYDETDANHYGTLMAERRRSGRPMSIADGQIAAICRTRGALLATRNVADFEGCGIPVVNPFDR